MSLRRMRALTHILRGRGMSRCGLKLLSTNADAEQIHTARLLLRGGCWLADVHLLARLQIARDFGQIAISVTRRHIDALRRSIGSHYIHVIARGSLPDRATGHSQHVAVGIE